MIAIGFAAPLTGPQAIVGVPMCRAAALAVEHYNARHAAGERVELVAVDDGADARGARSAAQKLLARAAVMGVVGHKNSDCCAATGALYAAGRLAHISPTATSSALSSQGWPTFFRVCADNARQAEVAAEAILTLRVGSVAAVHDGTAYGRPLAEAVVGHLTSAGVDLTAVVELPVGTDDTATIGAIAEALLAGRPELIYAGLTEVEGALLLRELRRRGSDVLFMGAEGGRQSAFLQLAGAAAEGCYHTYVGVDPETCPPAAAFAQQYARRYGEPPGSFGAESYDAAGILLCAIGENRQPTRDGVLRSLRGMPSYHGASGTITFEPNGNRRDAAVSLWQARDGRMHLIAPADLDRSAGQVGWNCSRG